MAHVGSEHVPSLDPDEEPVSQIGGMTVNDMRRIVAQHKSDYADLLSDPGISEALKDMEAADQDTTPKDVN